MITPNQSGRIMIEGDAISYVIPQNDGWRVPVADLRLIGERTDHHGPFADDYFFLFLTRNEHFEASFYAEGREELLSGLSRRLQHELRAGLCHSTDLASRLLWPARLEGHPIFDLIPEEPAATVLGRLKQRVWPKVHMRFTDEVRRELES